MADNKHYFYTSVWAKYVPIIRILIKKAASAKQELQFNRIDFERAGYTRKSGYKFSVSLINNKPAALFTGNELVQTFISALQSDAVIHEHLLHSNYTFVFSGKFLLQITNNSNTSEAEKTEQASTNA